MGQVYVLSNKDMHGLLKIGYTDGLARDRAKQLSSSTGVPSPFQVELIVESNTPERLEKKIHEELREYRHNKEFFKCSIENAVLRIKKFLILNPKEGSKILGPAAKDFLTDKESEEIKKAARLAQHKKDMLNQDIANYKYETEKILFNKKENFLFYANKFSTIAKKYIPNSRRHYRSVNNLSYNHLGDVGHGILGHTISSVYLAGSLIDKAIDKTLDGFSDQEYVKMKIKSGEEFLDLSIPKEKINSVLEEDERNTLYNLNKLLDEIYDFNHWAIVRYKKIKEECKKEGITFKGLGLVNHNEYVISPTNVIGFQLFCIGCFIKKHPGQVLFKDEGLSEFKYYAKFKGMGSYY